MSLRDFSHRLGYLPYEADTLPKLICDYSGARPEVVFKKLQVQWLQKVLQPLEGTGSVLVEPNYIDRNYIEDHAAFYSRSYAPPPRECTRLHFFGSHVDWSEVRAFLSGHDLNSFRTSFLNSANYSGFLVIRPLSKTFVGATCVRAPDSDVWAGAELTVSRKYVVHYLGAILEVHSLAFQEQDESVSSCATTALWTALHGTSEIFNHTLLTPATIARAATTRPWTAHWLPAGSDGLEDAQMAEAVRFVSLEPSVFPIGSSAAAAGEIIGCAYAYLKGGIPIILTGLHCTLGWSARALCTAMPDGPPVDVEAIDGHAVTIAGFGPFSPEPRRWEDGEEKGPLIRNLRPQCLFVHDDGLGPWSPVTPTHEFSDGEGMGSYLLTNWREDGKPVYLRADYMIVPLHATIRVTYHTIYAFVANLHEAIEELRDSGVLTLDPELEWEIFISSGAMFKEEIADSTRLQGGRRATLLLRPLPIYVWRAIGFANDNPMIEFVFDATDIVQGALFLLAVEYDKQVADVFRRIDFGKQLMEAYVPGSAAFEAWYSAGGEE